MLNREMNLCKYVVNEAALLQTSISIIKNFKKLEDDIIIKNNKLRSISNAKQ